MACSILQLFPGTGATGEDAEDGGDAFSLPCVAECVTAYLRAQDDTEVTIPVRPIAAFVISKTGLTRPTRSSMMT
eukprot:1178944-Prorocentrum_minimum.AAC.3